MSRFTNRPDMSDSRTQTAPSQADTGSLVAYPTKAKMEEHESQTDGHKLYFEKSPVKVNDRPIISFFQVQKINKLISQLMIAAIGTCLAFIVYKCLESDNIKAIKMIVEMKPNEIYDALI